MTREMFEEYVDKISACVNIYEHQNYRGAQNHMWLSGDQKKIIFSISDYNVAHLLGVNTEIIRERCLLSSEQTSYSILNYLISHKYQVYNKCFLDGKVFNPFSKYIDEKLAAFCKNIFPNFREIEAVVEVDKEKTYQSEYSNELMDVDFFVLRKREGLLYALGLRKLENSKNRYQPVTSMLVNNRTKDFLKKYLWKQNWYYVNGFEVRDYDVTLEKFRLTYKDAMDKILALQGYQRDYKGSICLSNDALNILKTFITMSNQQKEITIYVEWLIDTLQNIQSKKPEDLEDYEFEFLRIPEQKLFNKLTEEVQRVCFTSEKSGLSNEAVIDIYKENKKLKEEHDGMANEIATLRACLNAQKEELLKLRQEKDISTFKLQRIQKIVNEETFDKPEEKN